MKVKKTIVTLVILLRPGTDMVMKNMTREKYISKWFLKKSRGNTNMFVKEFKIL